MNPIPSSTSLTIAQPNPDGSLPVPAAAGASAASATAAQWQERAEDLQTKFDGLQAFLAKPLTGILADCEKARHAAAARGALAAA